MKSSLADAEIDEEIKAAKKEYHAIVNAARSEPALPPGMSRHDFTTWKEQQAMAARRRLTELEDRLQRLQMLRTKLTRMKANSHNTVLAPGGGSWTLPGQVHQTQQPGPTAKLGEMNASGDEGTTQYFDDDPDSSARNAEPYQPPFTPGMSGLRTIIRDEVALGVRKIIRYKSNKVSQVVTQNANTPDQHLAEAGVSKVVNLFTQCPACPAEQSRLQRAPHPMRAWPGVFGWGDCLFEDPLNLRACGRHQGPIPGCKR
jgi:hypothetical protein